MKPWESRPRFARGRGWQAALFPAGSVRGPGTEAPGSSDSPGDRSAGRPSRGWPTFAARLDKLRQLAGMPVVYVTRTLASYERKRLIEQKVPFLVPGNQLYLPDLGIDLREYFRKPTIAAQTATQPGDAGDADRRPAATGLGAPSGSPPRWSASWATPR
ncbi:MAG: hypothetical protein MZU91_12730 [Desulfosudis oleivorans]|nr:hypothetical protein [Desulfosudis oleivorans]